MLYYPILLVKIWNNGYRILSTFDKNVPPDDRDPIQDVSRTIKTQPASKN